MPPEIQNPFRNDAPLAPLADPADAIISLYDAESLALALQANQWDLSQEVRLLVDIMRNGSNRDRLGAQGRYRDLIREIASVSGLLTSGQTERTARQDGVTVRQVVTGTLINRTPTTRSPYGQRAVLPASAVRRPDPQSPASLPAPGIPGPALGAPQLAAGQPVPAADPADAPDPVADGHRSDGGSSDL